MDASRRRRIQALASFVLSWRTAVLLMFVLPLVGSLTWSEEFLHQTDYLLSFYVAGRLVWDGRAAEIYPDLSANSMVTAPLNRFAHELTLDEVLSSANPERIPELWCGWGACVLTAPLGHTLTQGGGPRTDPPHLKARTPTSGCRGPKDDFRVEIVRPRCIFWPP